MAGPERHKLPYKVDGSGVIAKLIVELQRQAAEEGRGNEFIIALKHICHSLEQDPRNFGEPAYHLSGLRLQVRTCVVRPLVVDFAVHEDNPVVFIKGVKLLSRGP